MLYLVVTQVSLRDDPSPYPPSLHLIPGRRLNSLLLSCLAHVQLTLPTVDWSIQRAEMYTASTKFIPIIDLHFIVYVSKL